MSEKTRLGLGIFAAALALGIFGDSLLRATPWGLNLPLWVFASLGSALALARRQGVAFAWSKHWLVAPIAFFSAAFAWRDSMTLKYLDALALLTAFSLAVLRAQAVPINLAGLLGYLGGLFCAGYNAALGPLLLSFGDIQWKEIPRGGTSRHASAIGRGLVVAVPLLVVFGGLFVTADVVFQNLVSQALHWSADNLFAHILLTAFYAWLATGFLRAVLLKQEGAVFRGERPRSLSLGIVEIGTALALLNALFLAFVIVQFRYFFGGAARVEAITGLSYSEYARRGFFELVTVSALALPLLLAAHWLLRKENPLHERIFRVLAAQHVLMLFVIMASAVQRMRLYQSEYGLTQLRFYTTVLMGWLALIFVWFAATVLRGQRQRFAFGALIAAFSVIAGLHVLNPDAFIVSRNLAHARERRTFDARYAASLSADAVPTLITALSELTDAERSAAAAGILERWTALEDSDWRAWSWARAQAAREVRATAATLRETK